MTEGEVRNLTWFLADLNATAAERNLTLAVDYDKDGAARIAVYDSGGTLAYIEHKTDGYEVVGMP